MGKTVASAAARCYAMMLLVLIPLLFSSCCRPINDCEAYIPHRQELGTRQEYDKAHMKWKAWWSPWPCNRESWQRRGMYPEGSWRDPPLRRR